MIFIFLLALLIFGPKKLPEIGRQIGKAMAEFKKASNEFKSQIEGEMRNLELEELAKESAKRPSEPQILPPEGTVPSDAGTAAAVAAHDPAPALDAPTDLPAEGGRATAALDAPTFDFPPPDAGGAPASLSAATEQPSSSPHDGLGAGDATMGQARDGGTKSAATPGLPNRMAE